MYSEDATVNHPAGIHHGTLSALGMHLQPGMVTINGLDPTDYNNHDQLLNIAQGHPMQVAAETGDPQTDRDAVHLTQGLVQLGRNPWMRPGVPVAEQPRLPIERYNQAANSLREKVLGLPQEPGNDAAFQSVSAHDKSAWFVGVSDDMSVVSKWQVVGLGELQQPGGVGATPGYNPVVDGPNPDGTDFADNAGNSPEQEVALQTWVNMAVDMLNRGESPDAILAQLAHDGCPNPQEVIQRAQQQPEQQQPISDEIGQDPFQAPPPAEQTGQMEGLSQQPPVQAKRVRIAGTTMTGTEIERWEGLWGEGTVKVALDGGGSISVAPDAIESIENDSYKHPVSEIQSFIDSLPEVQPTRPHIEARLANLELVRRAVRQHISSVGFSDQRKLEAMDRKAAEEAEILSEVLSNFAEEYEIGYVKSLPRFQYNAFETAVGEVVPWSGRAKEAGAIWATENFEGAVEDDDSFTSAAAHFANNLGLTGTQFQEFLAGATEHRKVRTEEFATEEPVDNDGPAEALFV